VAICILSVLYVWALYNISILAVGVRHLRRSGQKRSKASVVRAERLPTVSIIVPVKDEEKVMGRLLEAFLNVDYPPEKREIIVVEDGSADRTVEICEKYAKQYQGQIRLIRRPISNGKPSALNYALKHVKGEIVAVFDADNVPEPDALMRAVEYFEDSSIAAIQGRTCCINADENILTKFISYEEAVYCEAYLKGKDVLSLFVPLSGNCQFIRRDVLEKIGGWYEEALSEDMEISVKLTASGCKIRYAPDVRSWQESPANFTQLMKQRTRWFRGYMEVALRYGKLIAKPNRKIIDTEFTLAGPFMFPLWLLGYLITIYAYLVPIQPNPVPTVMAHTMSLLTMVLLLIVAIALIYVTKPKKIANLLWLPFIYVYWSAQTFLATYALFLIIFRRQRKWTKTPRSGVATHHNLIAKRV